MKNRIPRKLKKGCRTLNEYPRTKWQQKGRLYIAKMLENVAKAACAAAFSMDLLRQMAERINPVTFPSGGIVVPPPPKVGVAQMPTTELVVNHNQIEKLKGAIDINPLENLRAEMSSGRLQDVMRNIRKHANDNCPTADG